MSPSARPRARISHGKRQYTHESLAVDPAYATHALNALFAWAATLYHAKSVSRLSRDMLLLSASDDIVKEGMRMGMHERGLQLRGRNGHFEMATFELKKQPDGFWMWVSCDFDGHQGGHWLAPDAARPKRLVVTSEPYLWPSALEAYAARDRWEEQEGQ